MPTGRMARHLQPSSAARKLMAPQGAQQGGPRGRTNPSVASSPSGHARSIALAILVNLLAQARREIESALPDGTDPARVI